MSAPQYFDPLLEKDDPDHDQYRRAVVQHLAEAGLPVQEDVRIYQLDYNLRGQRIVATVGQEHARPGGDYVEFIFKSADHPGLYFITGPVSGVLRGGPVMVGQNMDPRPVHFSD